MRSEATIVLLTYNGEKYLPQVLEMIGRQKLQPHEIIEIDSRPSDAIALAIRAHIPIMVDYDILEQAGIKPEPAILDEDTDSTGEPDQPPLDKPAEKRLSIFEDFISKLDLDEGPDPDIDDPDDSPEKDN